MQRKFYFIWAFALLITAAPLMSQQVFQGNEAEKLCKGSKSVTINRQSRVPSFIVFREDSRYTSEAARNAMRSSLHMQFAEGLQLKKTQKDEIGFTHERYNQTYQGVRVEGGEYILHLKNGVVESANGMWFDDITVNATPSITPDDAVKSATQFVGAVTYKWESEGEEQHLKEITGDPSATYYPKGELVIVCKGGDIFKKEYALAWKLDVYASEPMSRQWIFVDAHTGEVVHSANRIHHIDTPATGTTMYSGTVNFTCDSFNGSYRLRESGRGQGIHTFDLNNSTSTANAVDFTNATTNWTSTANDDDAARDAHWGAEGTYDFFLNEMGRNGLDENGMLMVSYVHYGNNYNNAFWDGTSMTYGDGSQQAGGFNPLVGLDVCGHEFSHGVTEFSSNLVYQDEPGALNESFSDIFGAAIEWYMKPNQADWLMGEEITVTVGTALRSMSNPNQYGDPDCYTGTNWYTGTADNGGVHTNSGVQNFWYYILSVGGSGTNDLNDAYNVTGIGWYDAARIAYRNNCFYLVSTSQYADARTYAIQSAQDLFGACSPEVIATTNAWYACGVGPAFVAGVTAAFTADVTFSCSVPAVVNFTNTSTNGANATWDFGDNTTDTAYNPTHTYNAAGTYNVQLINSSACGIDSVVQTAYIVVNPPASPVANGTSICNPASVTLNATGSGSLTWYTQPVGGSSVASGTTYVTPVLSGTTTYYVQNDVAQAPSNVGPANSSFGTGGMHNNTSTQYLEFTVYQNCTLVSGLVNAGSAGNKTFTLWDNAGNVINNYTVNVPNTGNNTVTLNIPLTPGAYRLGGTQMNLYRNNAGASYPYAVNGLVSITGSSAGSAFYYYLYNWLVQPEACESARTPVTVTVGAPNITLDVSAYDTTCTVSPAFSLNGGFPVGGTYSGPGVSNGMFDPATAGPGVHMITYTYTDTAGCTGSVSQQVIVDVCSGIQTNGALAGNMLVYPNPADADITIEFAENNSGSDARLEVMNAMGQVVRSEEIRTVQGVNRWMIQTADLSGGMYFIRLNTTSGVYVQKIELK